MKIILFALIFSSFFMKNTSIKKSTQYKCIPTNDPTIMLDGVFNHEPITECEGDIYYKSFEDLNGWVKRETKSRELFENSSFSNSNVIIKNGVLNLKAGFNKATNNGCVDEFGSQVTLQNKKFGPIDGFTYSAIMQPTEKSGIVSAFFVHLIDENTNDPNVCNNNNEIDIEVVKYGSEVHPSLKGKLFAYFTSWQRAIRPWGYKDNSCAADPNAWDQRKRESHGIELNERFVKEFHKYSFTWTKSEIKFYIDDVFITKHTKSIPQVACPLKINSWASQGWLGYSKNKVFKAVTKIKEVSVSSIKVK